MAVSCRHAVDDDSPTARFCLLAICLVASSLLHGLVLLVPWSTLGSFNVMGPAAERRPGPASRASTDRRQTRLRIDFSVLRAPVVEGPRKDEVVRHAVALPQSIPEPVPPSSAEREPVPEWAETEKLPRVEETSLGEPETRAVPLPQYFPAEKLTRQPELAEEMDGSFRESLEAGFRGHVVIRLFLDETGKANKVRVMESSLPIEIEGLVVQAFFLARYRPGEIDGQPVMSEITVGVDLSTTIESPKSAGSVAAPVGGKAGSGTP